MKFVCSLSLVESETLGPTFDSLVSFDISFNRFRHLPSALHRLPELKYFNGSNNLITLDFTTEKTPFHYCTKLRVLDLSNNRIVAIGNPFFDGLLNLSHVYLGGNLFTMMGDRYFFDQSHMHTLSLPNGRINEIYIIFPFELKVLDLVQNDFKFSENTKKFQMIPSLERLNIGHSKLRYYPATFSGLKTLFHLRIESLDQDTFDSDILSPLLYLLDFEIHKGMVKNIAIKDKKYLTEVTLSNLPNLTTISLVNCRSLNKEMIKLFHLPKLKELNIHYLDSFDLDKDFLFFDGIKNLKVLNLSLNFITKVSFDYLNRFSSLEVLDLSNNKISHLQIQTFAALPQLHHLNLSGNTLTGFPSHKFIFSSSALLNLSYNIIKNVNPQFFSSLTNVTTCDLSFNYINSMAATVKTSKVFYMLDNAWDCECLSVEDINSNYHQVCHNSSSIFCNVCHSSTKHSGRAVFVRGDHCAPLNNFESTITISILVGAAVFLSIVAATRFLIKKRNCLIIAKINKRQN